MISGQLDLHPGALPARPCRRSIPLLPDLLDKAVFIPCVWILSGLGIYLRLGGAALVMLLIAALVAYAVLRRTPPPLWLSIYMTICLLAGLLSYFHLFPSSWQVYFRGQAIVRQMVPVVSFFSMAWAARAYFERRLRAGDAFGGGGIILVLGLVVAPVIMLLQGFQYEEGATVPSTLAMYGSFTNNIIIVMFFITAYTFAGTSQHRALGIITILAIAAVTPLAQFPVFICGVIAILAGVSSRFIAAALIAALVGLYAIGMFYIPELMVEAPNSGIRLVFIQDAFRSAYDTLGMGIGYGTESVRWRYYFPNRPEVTFLPDVSTMTADQLLEVLSTGVHNSFMQALLRTGAIGFFVLSAAFIAAFPPRYLPRSLRNHAAVLFIIMFIACFVNPALESPIQGIGVGFLYGYLIALKKAFAPSRRVQHVK